MSGAAETTRRLLEAFNANRPEDVADLITDDFIDHHVPAEITRGLDGLSTWWSILHSAFEGRIDVDDVVEGDDRVASRWSSPELTSGSSSASRRPMRSSPPSS
jgi:hypothetical protein